MRTKKLAFRRKRKRSRKLRGGHYNIESETLNSKLEEFSHKLDVYQMTYQVNGLIKNQKIKLNTNYDSYKEEIKTKLLDWTRSSNPITVSHLHLHGRYFKQYRPTELSVKYIKIPDNVIVCFLTPPDTLGVTYIPRSKEMFRDSGVIPHMINYRSRLIDSNLKYKRHTEAHFDSYDMFKFSSWYYPGQYCNNYSMYYSRKELQNYGHESFDIENEGTVFNHYTIQKLNEIFGRRDYLNFSLHDILKITKTTKRYILLLNGCNMTNLENNNLLHDTIWKQYHLNRQLVREIEDSLGTPTPESHITDKYSCQNLRSIFQSLYRHTVGKTPNFNTEERLTTFQLLYYQQSRNFEKKHNIDFLYHILTKINNSTYDEISDMTEYVRYIQNLPPLDMNIFCKHGTFVCKNQDKLHYFLRFVFDRGNYLFHTRKHMLKYFQILKVFYLPQNQAIHFIRSERVMFQKLVLDNLDTIFKVKKLVSPSLGRDLSIFNGMIRGLYAKHSVSNKIIIRKNDYTVPLLDDIKDTLRFESTTDIISKEIDITTHKNITILEFESTDLSVLNDSNFKYDIESIHGNKLNCLCQNSKFQGNIKFKILQSIISLEIKDIPPEQTNINIGHYFLHLENVYIERKPFLSRVSFHNHKIKRIGFETHQETNPTERNNTYYNVRCSNLEMLKFQNNTLDKLFLYGCHKLKEMIIINCDIDIPTLQKVLNNQNSIKTLEIMNSRHLKPELEPKQIIELTNSLEDIKLENISFEIGINKTNLKNVKYITIISVDLNMNFISRIQEFELDKLIYLYQNLLYHRKLIPTELIDVICKESPDILKQELTGYEFYRSFP